LKIEGEFKLSRARDLDLDLGSGHTAYSHASLIDLYLYTKFHWNRRNFLWTDGRTDIFHPSNIIRSTFGSRPKKRSERRKHCTLAVVRWSQKFRPDAAPLRRKESALLGARGGQNLISWRWSLPLPTNPVWWGSMHTILSYRGNRPQTHTQTHTHKPRQDQLQYTVPVSLVCSVTKQIQKRTQVAIKCRLQWHQYSWYNLSAITIHSMVTEAAF